MEAYPIALLQSSALFRGIPEAELRALLGCLAPSRQRYPAGSLIYAEGAPAGQIGLVLTGQVQIAQEDFYGSRHLIAVLQPGETFAEAFACAGAAALPVSVFARQECSVLLFAISRILHPCQNSCAAHQKIVLNLLQDMARKNLQMNQKLFLLSRKTTRRKLMAYLCSCAKAAGSSDFTIPLDRQQLADYLGVDRSAMSAELSKLCKEGYLQTHKSHFCLLRSWQEEL